MRTTLALVLAALLGSSAVAQTTVTGTPAAPDARTSQDAGGQGSGGQGSVTRPNADTMRPGAAAPTGAIRLEAGANSFTEGEARTRLAEAGFTDARDLRKDPEGIWRGTATQDGRSVQVGLDFKGNVSAQ